MLWRALSRMKVKNGSLKWTELCCAAGMIEPDQKIFVCIDLLATFFLIIFKLTLKAQFCLQYQTQY